jgi:hypothetical protein
MDKAKALFDSSHIPVTLYETFPYTARNWENPRQIVGKVEVNEGKTILRFVVYSLTEPELAVIYRTIYSGRGQMENYIKDHKLGLKSDRTSCHNFMANQFRLFILSAAYITYAFLKKQYSQGNSMGQGSIRHHPVKAFQDRGQGSRNENQDQVPSSFVFPL